MKAVSRKGFVPFVSDRDAVIPTYLLAGHGHGPSSNVLYRTSIAVPVHTVTRRPPYPTECHEYRLCSIPAARKWDWRFEVICTGVSARFPLSPLSRTLKKTYVTQDLCDRSSGQHE